MTDSEATIRGNSRTYCAGSHPRYGRERNDSRARNPNAFSSCQCQTARGPSEKHQAQQLFRRKTPEEFKGEASECFGLGMNT
jgi:hypothetical protein